MDPRLISGENGYLIALYPPLPTILLLWKDQYWWRLRYCSIAPNRQYWFSVTCTFFGPLCSHGWQGNEWTGGCKFPAVGINPFHPYQASALLFLIFYIVLLSRRDNQALCLNRYLLCHPTSAFRNNRTLTTSVLRVDNGQKNVKRATNNCTFIIGYFTDILFSLNQPVDCNRLWTEGGITESLPNMNNVSNNSISPESKIQKCYTFLIYFFVCVVTKMRISVVFTPNLNHICCLRGNWPQFLVNVLFLDLFIHVLG